MSSSDRMLNIQFKFTQLTSHIKIEGEKNKKRITNQEKNIFCKWCHLCSNLNAKTTSACVCPKGSLVECSGVEYKYSVTYNSFCRNVSHFPASSPCPASLASITIGEFDFDSLILNIEYWIFNHDWFWISYILLKSPCRNFTIQQLTHRESKIVEMLKIIQLTVKTSFG